MRLEIYKLDSDERVATLGIGKHTIGRGKLLKCTDMRVSRNHALIEVTPDKASIISTHVNPCFHRGGHDASMMVTVSEKEPLPLNSGDKFGLIADNFWYKVKVIEGTDHVIEDRGGEISLQEQQTVTIPTQNIVISKNNNDKRSSTRNEEDSARKKPADNGALNENPNNGERSSKDNEAREKPAENGALDENPNNEERSSGENEEEPARKTPTEGIAINENSNNDKRSSEENDEEPARKKRKSAMKDSGGNKDVPIPSTQSNTQANQTEEPPTNSNGLIAAEDIKQELLSVGDETASEPENREQSNQVAPEQSSSGTQTTTRARRERCWYGDNCYRKNQTHFTDFAHPTDDDYASDPNDNRPVCSYGAACYRRNRDHRQQYKHPGPPAFKTRDDGKRRRRGGKRGAPKKRASSPDDYDYDDPFIDDSGPRDPYETDSGDEYLPDSDETTGESDED